MRQMNGAIGCSLLVVSCLVVLGAGKTPDVAGKPSPEMSSAMEQLKKLEGEWTMVDESGNSSVTNVFKISSNGSVIRETMFPGAAHEMTNIYHMDGPDLVMTHYCAVGNQPRLKVVSANEREIHFKWERVGNFTAADQTYMGELRLVMPDKNQLEQHWTSFKNGEPVADHAPVFKLTRKG